MNSVNVKEMLIDENSRNYAKIYSALLKDEFQRKRAFASISALFALIKVLENTPYDLQKSMTLFRNPVLNEQYEITDLYLNNWHLDVRVVTNSDNVLIPKIHYGSDIVPDFYVVIKVDELLEKAQLLGVIDAKTTIKTDFDNNYYSVALDTLMTYEDFLANVQDVKEVQFSEEDHEFLLENYLGLMDNEIDEETKNKVLNHLFLCPQCRTEFCCFTGFEMVSCNCVKYPEIIEDDTLGIVGAQNVDEEKYADKEEIINFDEEEEALESQINSDTKADEELTEEAPEETVSDILEELFSVDEGFIENPDTIVEKQVEEDLVLIEESDFVLDINNEEENSEIEEIKEIENIEESDNSILLDESVQLVDFEENEELKQDEDLMLLDENQEELEIIELSDDDNSEIEVITENIQEEDSLLDEDIEEVIEDNTELIEEEIIDISENNEDLQEENTFAPEEDNMQTEEQVQIVDSSFAKEDMLESILDDDGDLIVQEYADNQVNEAPVDIETVENLDNEDLEYNEDEYETIETTGEQQDVLPEEFNQNSEEEYPDEEYEDDEYDVEDVLPEEQLADGSSKVPLIIVSILVLLGLIGGGTFFFLKNKTNSNAVVSKMQNDNNAIEIAKTDTVNDMFENKIESENVLPPVVNEIKNPQNQDSSSVEQITGGDLIVPKKSVAPTRVDVNNAMASAFQNRTGASFKGLNWFCTSELFSDVAFKDYLQNLDNLLKQNLKNNILNSTETPQQDSVEAKFAVDNNGNLKKVIISKSSGSKQIDDIVLQSINESFVGEKSPILNDSTFKSDMYFLKVVIKL